MKNKIVSILMVVFILTVALAAAASQVQAINKIDPMSILVQNQNNVPASVPVYYIQMHAQDNPLILQPSACSDDYVCRYIQMHTPGIPLHPLK